MNWKLLGPSPKKWTDNYKCATAARGHNTLYMPHYSLLDLDDYQDRGILFLPLAIGARRTRHFRRRAHPHTRCLRGDERPHDASQAGRIHARRLAGCPTERCDRTAIPVKVLDISVGSGMFDVG